MGARGPAPKANSLKILAGNPGKRDLKENHHPLFDEVPKPPTWLGKYGKKEWKRVAPHLHNMKILSKVSISLLETYCSNYEQTVEAEKSIRAKGYTTIGSNGNLVKSPWVDIKMQAQRMMITASKEMGITPTSNGLMDFGDEKENPLTELLKNKRRTNV